MVRRHVDPVPIDERDRAQRLRIALDHRAIVVEHLPVKVVIDDQVVDLFASVIEDVNLELAYVDHT